jgi:hypothetical protein
VFACVSITKMSPNLVEVVIGVAIGGALAGGVLYATSGKSQADEVAGERCHLSRDQALLCMVAEPSELFRRIDSNATDDLLDSLDDLVRLFGEARVSKRPSIVAHALAARRKGKRSIEILKLGARSSFPARASEVVDDTDALMKAIGDYLHNTQQASALSMLESVD